MKNVFIDDQSINNQKYGKVFGKSIFLIILLFLLTTIASFSSNNLLIQLVSLLLVGLFFLISQKMKIYFLTSFHFSKRDLLYILIGFVSTYSFDIIYHRLFNSISDNQSLVHNVIQDNSIFSTFILFAITIPIIEEVLFRGIILRLLFRNHLFIGFIVSSVLFALYHPANSVIDYIPYLISGLIFGFIYLKTKKLEASIVLHILNNSVAILFMHIS